MADPFELADGMVKQVLTLATGSLGGIIAFFDDDKTTGVQLSGSGWLTAAIVLLASSVVAGLLTLGALTHQLTLTQPNANAGDVRYPAMVELVAFAAGIVAVAVEIVR